jgi:hypothetical protein
MTADMKIFTHLIYGTGSSASIIFFYYSKFIFGRNGIEICKFFLKFIEISFRIFLGLLELWLPSNNKMFFGPLYASNN